MTGLPGQALLGQALLVAVVVAALTARLNKVWRGAAAASAALAALAPLSADCWLDCSLAGRLRGGLGDLSVVTWCWLLADLAERLTGRRAMGAGERRALAAAIVAVAAAVYCAALGGPTVDVYRWGYGGTELSVAAVAAAAAAWLWHCDFIVAAVATALLAFRCELLESANLWDYLFDPVLAALAAAVLLRESYLPKRP